MADVTFAVANGALKRLRDMGDGTHAEVVSDAGSITPPTAPTTSSYTTLNTSFASSGDNTVVSATAGQTTRVFALALTFASPVDVTIKDGAATTLGVFQGIISLVLDPLLPGVPRYITTANTAFIINLSAAIACKGTIWHTKG